MKKVYKNFQVEVRRRKSNQEFDWQRGNTLMHTPCGDQFGWCSLAALNQDLNILNPV